MQTTKKNYKEFLINYALYMILGLLILGIIVYDPTFLSPNNFINILMQASTRAIMALGVAGLIVLQGTDLSAGRVMGLSAAFAASLLQSTTYAARMYPQLGDIGLFIPLLIAILAGVIFGLINGFGVAVLKIHAFIITLGTQLIAFGIINLYINSQASGAQPLGTLNEKYLNFVTGRFFGIPYVVFYLLITAIIMWVIWNKTTLGKNMFAIGGNPEAAEVSGINIVKTILIVYVISGVLYGFAGFLEGGRLGSVNPNTGFAYELDAISACVVGGVSFSGGVGTIPGVLLGAVLLQLINYGLNYIGVDPNVQYLVRGLIIIVAVAIDVRKYLKKK
ncbi:MAG: galactose/methyl galactoside ABC transporter permease MglC [Eubacteriales bacterium]|nr:galactose/methyl galactoside ABC transporter permease MglC [Eubacteriales bacterium]